MSNQPQTPAPACLCGHSPWAPETCPVHGPDPHDPIPDLAQLLVAARDNRRDTVAIADRIADALYLIGDNTTASAEAALRRVLRAVRPGEEASVR